MVEEPNFNYKYELAYQKSFAARLSFRIMGIAAGVFLAAVCLFFYFTGDSMTLPLTHQIVKYGTIVFIVGLTSLFVFCTWAIYRMVKPLQQFAESAISIAEGNLDTPLPDIQSEDELLQLRNTFEHMMHSLKQHMIDLQTTTASKERLQSELTIAHDIQMGMIPTTFPQRQDLDLFASMTPAKEVGGDLYDFILEGDELFFIIGDVAGKGVPASLYMAVTRTLFRNLAGNYQSAANIVREMNHAIASTNDTYIFVTVFVGVLDMKTHYLTYCNAAHNAPVMISAEGECSLLEVDTNLPIGIEDRYHYEEQQVDFPPGSALLLYTDGLTEAMNATKEQFRMESVNDVAVKAHAEHQQEPHQLIDLMTEAVGQFVGGAEQSDDLTMMAIQYIKKQNSIVLPNDTQEVPRLNTFVSDMCNSLDAPLDVTATSRPLSPVTRTRSQVQPSSGRTVTVTVSPADALCLSTETVPWGICQSRIA